MASFFDDFNRSNGSLGNNWVNIVGSFSIVSNTVYAGTVGLNYNSVNANSAIFSTNQSSQITVSSLRAIDRVGPAVRVTSNGAYVIRVDGQNNSTARILRFNGNTATSIGTVNIVPANGDIVKLTAAGNTLTAYINDVLIDTVNIQDANTANVFTTGQPGLFYNWGDIRQTRIDNFYATDVAQIFSVDTDNNIFPGQTNVVVSGENLGEITKANLVFGSKSIDMLGFTSNVSAPTFNVPNIASIKTAGFEFGDVYLVLANSNTVIVNTSITLSPPAGYGVHDVTDLTYSNDPNNIYSGQVPAIEVGDQILYDNSPNVFIDYVGYPEFSNGATSFNYSIYDATYGTWSIDSTVSIQKEINAVSRSFGVRKSADGKQYSKYPNGNYGTSLSNILYYEDFSTLNNGTNFYSGTRFDVQTSPGIIDDDPKGIYGKVVKDIMTAGQEDKCWGGIYDLKAQEDHYLASGDEIWIAFRLLLPTGSSTVANPRLKFLRLNIYNAALSTIGYIDTLLPILASADAWVYSNEVLPGAPITQLSSDDSTRPDLDQWQTWEFHIVLDDTAAGSGGTGKVEFWKNSTIVGALNVATLSADSQLGRRVLVHDYWNGGAPQNQTFYWTDFACAVKSAGWRDDTPYLVTDLGGRKMIGLI